MELDANQVVPVDSGHDFLAGEIDGGRHVTFVLACKVVAVHVVEGLAIERSVENGAVRSRRHGHPPDVRDPVLRQLLLQLDHVPGNQAQPGSVAILETAICQHLHAEADADERPFRVDGVSTQQRAELVRVQARHRALECANPGQHQDVCLIHFARVLHDRHLRTDTVKCIRDRQQVADVQIDDGNAWSRHQPISSHDIGVPRFTARAIFLPSNAGRNLGASPSPGRTARRLVSSSTSPACRSFAMYKDRRYTTERFSASVAPYFTVPSDCQARSVSTTRELSSAGSSEKLLSTPPSARLSVKCFSITVAPSATAATAAPTPMV